MVDGYMARWIYKLTLNWTCIRTDGQAEVRTGRLTDVWTNLQKRRQTNWKKRLWKGRPTDGWKDTWSDRRKHRDRKKDCYMHLQLDRKTHRWIDRKTEKFDGSAQGRQMNRF